MIDRGAFELARESVTAEQAAAFYGVELHGHRAACPFHGGERDSLSFHGHGFRCFSCGASGDSVEFVRRLFECKPIDALRRLDRSHTYWECVIAEARAYSKAHGDAFTTALLAAMFDELEREFGEVTANGEH
jgi:hypothetical protein